MQIPDEVIQLIQNHQCQFVSFKYLDDDGMLKQLDIAVQTIARCNNIWDYQGIQLNPIPYKVFIDPFRSVPTVSVYCEDASNANSVRQMVKNINLPDSLISQHKLAAEISFWINQNTTAANNFDNISDPIDQYANLRSDIVTILENIGIETTIHRHGPLSGQSIVGINGKTAIDLADNIVISKFIINNCAASYGFSTNFSSLDNTNLTLIIKELTKQNYKKIKTEINHRVFNLNSLNYPRFIIKPIQQNIRENRCTLFIPLIVEGSCSVYFFLLLLMQHDINRLSVRQFLDYANKKK